MGSKTFLHRNRRVDLPGWGSLGQVIGTSRISQWDKIGQSPFLTPTCTLNFERVFISLNALPDRDKAHTKHQLSFFGPHRSVPSIEFRNLSYLSAWKVRQNQMINTKDSTKTFCIHFFFLFSPSIALSIVSKALVDNISLEHLLNRKLFSR